MGNGQTLGLQKLGVDEGGGRARQAQQVRHAGEEGERGGFFAGNEGKKGVPAS